MGFAIKVGDTKAWTMTLEEDGDPVDLSLATAVQCHVFEHGSTEQIMDRAGSIVSGSSTAGRISVSPSSSEVSSSGYYDLEIEVTWTDGTESTWPNAGFEELHIGRQLK